jgi:hypothetical protein
MGAGSVEHVTDLQVRYLETKGCCLHNVDPGAEHLVTVKSGKYLKGVGG